MAPRDESELNMGEFVSVAERESFFPSIFDEKIYGAIRLLRKGGGALILCVARLKTALNLTFVYESLAGLKI